MTKREIKFRAWDWVKRKMVYSTTEYFDDMVGFRFEHFEHDNEAELMQYTGLKDKNGVEIYTDDIVEMKYKVVNDFAHDLIGTWRGRVVILASRGVCINPAKLVDCNKANLIGITSQYKPLRAYRTTVVGNIHNPELLQTEGGA